MDKAGIVLRRVIIRNYGIQVIWFQKADCMYASPSIITYVYVSYSEISFWVQMIFWENETKTILYILYLFLLPFRLFVAYSVILIDLKAF